MSTTILNYFSLSRSRLRINPLTSALVLWFDPFILIGCSQSAGLNSCRQAFGPRKIMNSHSDSTPIKTHCESCNCELLQRAKAANDDPCECRLILCNQCIAPKELGDHGQVYHKKTASEDSPQSGAPVCPHCGRDVTDVNLAMNRVPDAEKIAVFMIAFCLNPACRKILPCAFMGYEPLPPKYDDKPDSRLVKLARGGGVLTNDALARSIRNATRNGIRNVRKVQ